MSIIKKLKKKSNHTMRFKRNDGKPFKERNCLSMSRKESLPRTRTTPYQNNHNMANKLKQINLKQNY
jgi:hypothetical protein